MKLKESLPADKKVAILEFVNVFVLATEVAGEAVQRAMLSEGHTNGETPLDFALREALSILHAYGYDILESHAR